MRIPSELDVNVQHFLNKNCTDVDLIDLEGIHNSKRSKRDSSSLVLEVYQWLAMRYQDEFVDIEQVKTTLGNVQQVIEKILGQAKFSFFKKR